MSQSKYVYVWGDRLLRHDYTLEEQAQMRKDQKCPLDSCDKCVLTTCAVKLHTQVVD